MTSSVQKACTCKSSTQLLAQANMSISVSATLELLICSNVLE